MTDTPDDQTPNVDDDDAGEPDPAVELEGEPTEEHDTAAAANDADEGDPEAT